MLALVRSSGAEYLVIIRLVEQHVERIRAEVGLAKKRLRAVGAVTESKSASSGPMTRQPSAATPHAG